MSKGTVIKRHHKDGKGHSWLVKYDAAPDPLTGQRRQRYKTINGDKTEAERELRALLTAVDNNTDVQNSRETVAEWLRRWLTDYAPMNCGAQTTLIRYGQFVEKHIIPEIGALPLQKLRTAQVQRLYAAKHKDGRLNSPGGLSKRTVHHLHRCLSKALTVAVSEGIIAKNPCDNAQTPKPDEIDIACLDDAETVIMLEAATGSRSPNLYALVTLGVTTGMRRGEMLGLKWKDVDLDGGCLEVKASLEMTENGVRLKSPKTKSSKRKIHLPTLAVAVLIAHKAAQSALRLQLGFRDTKDRFVFERFDDDKFHPLTPNAVTKMFSVFIRDVDVPRITLHGLRHTAATSAIRAGENIVAVSKRLGHAKPSITLNVYAHYIPGDDADIASNLDARLAGLLNLD